MDVVVHCVFFRKLIIRHAFFLKLIDGVSDTDILSSQDREIIVKIQEISVLLSAGKEEQQIMSRTIAEFPTLV